MKRINHFLSFLRSSFSPWNVGFLIFYVTNRCNFRCKFCFYLKEIEKGKKADELTLSEIETIAHNTGPLVQLSLTGGEPFLRNDLVDVANAFIKYTKPMYLTIPTNASLPEQILRFFEVVLPKHKQTNFRLVFSVDGIGEVHDTIRSSPGAYGRMKESYRELSVLRKHYKNLVLDANSVFCAIMLQTL